ncbi:hypothetical protein BJ170DRAFT_679649 [Xylariales sp. AK1849]|nr:hypothetical protein BJ170DRAFT_679649 [Xylariales sp. AK1849]
MGQKSIAQTDEGDDSTAKRKRVASAEVEPRTTKKARLASELSMTSTEDSKALDAVEPKFETQVHSVISSSKIHKKVSSVLRHLTVLDSSSKPRVSILRAKASDAGKLVTIAEIAKREISQASDGGGRWFQYIGLGGETKETPKEKRKATVEDTVLGVGDRAENDDADVNADEEDDFEYMITPFERAIEGRPRKQAVAIMSLFLSRVSVDELKRRYGEQTNDGPTKGPT